MKISTKHSNFFLTFAILILIPYQSNIFLSKICFIYRTLRKHGSGVSLPAICLSALAQLLFTFSSFSSPYLVEIVCKLAILKSKISSWESENSNDGKSLNRVSLEISNRVDEVIDSVAKTHFRLLVPQLSKIYSELRQESIKHLNDEEANRAVLCFSNFLAKSVAKWKREEVLPHLPKLHSFFVQAFEYRNEVHSKDVVFEAISDAEDRIFESIIALALKLTESEMRPLFFKVTEWCSRAIEEKEPMKLVTFYRFAVKLADSLKSLVHLFAAPIFKQAVEVLQLTNPTTSNETLFKKNADLDRKLRGYVLDLLTLLFTHDASGFTTRQRFDAVEGPLIDQLELAELNEPVETYMQYIRLHAGPAIVALAVAVSEDSAWKIVNHSLLTKTQHQNANVRLATLHCLDLLVTKMADDYSSVLPDTVPYLAPLMEDDDPTVESACKDLAAKLDNILGEPIAKFI